MRAALTLAVVVAGLFVVFGACTSSPDCCGACPADQPAVFQLTCDTADLTSAIATGPCASPSGGPSSEVSNGIVAIDGLGTGVCHVALAFATGFTFATDVTFKTQSGGVCGGPQCKCPDFVAATSGPFAVHNPSTTCLDAGSDVDADSDLEAGVNICPSDASQSIPCSGAEGTTCQGCRDFATFRCTCGSTDAGPMDAGASSPIWQCVDTYRECGR